MCAAHHLQFTPQRPVELVSPDRRSRSTGPNRAGQQQQQLQQEGARLQQQVGWHASHQPPMQVPAQGWDAGLPGLQISGGQVAYGQQQQHQQQQHQQQQQQQQGGAAARHQSPAPSSALAHQAYAALGSNNNYVEPFSARGHEARGRAAMSPLPQRGGCTTSLQVPNASQAMRPAPNGPSSVHVPGFCGGRPGISFGSVTSLHSQAFDDGRSGGAGGSWVPPQSQTPQGGSWVPPQQPLGGSWVPPQSQPSSMQLPVNLQMPSSFNDPSMMQLPSSGPSSHRGPVDNIKRPPSLGGCSLGQVSPGQAWREPRESRHKAAIPVQVEPVEKSVFVHQQDEKDNIAEIRREMKESQAQALADRESMLEQIAAIQAGQGPKQCEECASLRQKLDHELHEHEMLEDVHRKAEEKHQKAEDLHRKVFADRTQLFAENSRLSQDLQERGFQQAGDQSRRTASLEADLDRKTSSVADLERKLKAEKDQKNNLQVRFNSLEKGALTTTSEKGKLETDNSKLQAKHLALEQRSDSLECEKRARQKQAEEADFRMSQRDRELSEKEARLKLKEQDMKALQEEMVRRDRSGQEQKKVLDQQGSSFQQHQSQLDRTSQALQEREQLLAERSRKIEQEYKNWELQRTETEHQLKQQKAELDSLTKEQQDKARKEDGKRSESDKEIKLLRQTIQEQKSEIFRLETELQKDQSMCNMMTPGEFIRAAKKAEGETFSNENLELKLENRGLKEDLKWLCWESELMRKHIPKDSAQAVATDMMEDVNPAHKHYQVSKDHAAWLAAHYGNPRPDGSVGGS